MKLYTKNIGDYITITKPQLQLHSGGNFYSAYPDRLYKITSIKKMVNQYRFNRASGFMETQTNEFVVTIVGENGHTATIYSSMNPIKLLVKKKLAEEILNFKPFEFR